MTCQIFLHSLIPVVEQDWNGEMVVVVEENVEDVAVWTTNDCRLVTWLLAMR